MIEKGQILTLKIRFNNSGTIASVPHPLLVIDVDKQRNLIEVAHIDSISPEKKMESFVKI